jgi:4-amino-4-deoxy-L-arabinose transferase-like glycosyltransferase
MYGLAVARAAAWTWAFFPYAIYWPTRVVWETSLTAFLLSLALVLALRMADQPLGKRDWIIFGLLWGVIALTNTAVLSMFPFCLLWLMYRLPRDSRRFTGAAVCILTTILVMTPWLARNYATFGKFVFIRDNLPLEMHMANNDRLTGLWTRDEHPGNDPQAMQKFQQLGEMRFMEEKQQQVRQFIVEHPVLFIGFSLERAVYFWIAPPQANIVAGYDLSFARHIGFLIPAILAFGGLWISIRNRVKGSFLLACFLIIYPLPYYLVNPFPRYKHPIEPEMIMLAVYLFWQASRVQIRWPLVHKE